jgi:DNA-binding transcriptional regulator YhcF (GntR family)
MRAKADHTSIRNFAAANPLITYRQIANQFGVALITVYRACVNLRRISKVVPS